MSIKEKIKEMRSDYELKKEMKKFKNSKCENLEVKNKKFNFEKLKDIGLVAIAVMLIGVRIR